MKKTPLFALALLAGTLGYAQEKSILRADFIFPGLTYENKLDNKWTLESSIKLTPRMDISTISGHKTSYYATFNPTVSTQANYYYNIDRRRRLGKNTTLNSANYFSLGLAYEQNVGWNITNRENIINNKPGALFIYSGWGFQRTLSNKLYYNIFLGGAYVPSRSVLVPHISIKFGYTLWASTTNN